MTGQGSAIMRRHSEMVHSGHTQYHKKSAEKATPRELTARMLSEAIVEIYRLSGWPPWRVASEIAKGVAGRQDVLRWARDGVPQDRRHEVWARVEQLQQRLRPARHWSPERVRRLRERVGCRLDLALEVGVDLETVRCWERGECRPTEEQADRLVEIEKGSHERADDRA